MKKTFSFLLLTLLFAAPLMFSSCDPGPTDDEILAMLVDGSWDGTMDISYTHNGVKYQSTSTHVQFWNYVNSTTSGEGKWCNTFTENAPITNLSYDFTWEAKDQVIYLTFKTESSEYADKATVKIGTYYIDPTGFTGKISTLDNPWDVYPFYP